MSSLRVSKYHATILACFMLAIISGGHDITNGAHKSNKTMFDCRASRIFDAAWHMRGAAALACLLLIKHCYA